MLVLFFHSVRYCSMKGGIIADSLARVSSPVRSLHQPERKLLDGQTHAKAIYTSGSQRANKPSPSTIHPPFLARIIKSENTHSPSNYLH